MKKSPSWWQRYLRGLVFSLLVLLTLVVLVGSLISFLGRREWKQVKDALEGRGEKLSLWDHIPPPVPDELNFFSDPLWTELASDVPQKNQRLFQILMVPLDPEEIAFAKSHLPAQLKADFWRGRGNLLHGAWHAAKKYDEAQRNALATLTLKALEPSAPTLDTLLTLLQRPAARYPVNYEAGPAAKLDHLTTILSVCNALCLRARAELQLKQAALASRDILAAIALSRTVAPEPFLISFLVRQAALVRTITPIREGMKTHAWSEAELRTFEVVLSKEDLPKALAHAWRGDRGNINSFMENGSRDGALFMAMNSGPEGTDSQALLMIEYANWYLRILGPADQAYANLMFQGWIDALENRPKTGLSPAMFETKPEKTKSALFKLTHFVSLSTTASYTDSVQNMCRDQDLITQARTACALELYYLKRQEYPATLDPLVSEYLPALPCEVVTLQPLRYERMLDGTYQLWSRGWDGKDDERNPVAVSKTQWKGDWVWESK